MSSPAGEGKEAELPSRFRRIVSPSPIQGTPRRGKILRSPGFPKRKDGGGTAKKLADILGVRVDGREFGELRFENIRVDVLEEVAEEENIPSRAVVNALRSPPVTPITRRRSDLSLTRMLQEEEQQREREMNRSHKG